MKERNEIEEKYKWDLSSYGDDESFFDKLKKLEPFIDGVKQFKNKLGDGDQLLKYFRYCDEFYEPFIKLNTYVSLREDQDQGVAKYQEMSDACQKLYTEFSVNSTYADVEICKLPIAKLKAFAVDPKFSDYSVTIKEYIKSKSHMLSEKEEKLLAGMSMFINDDSEIYSKFANVDIKYQDAKDSAGASHEVNEAIYSVYMQNSDRVLRKNAYHSLINAYKDCIHVLAANYAMHVKKNAFFAKQRKFKSVLEEALYSEDITENVYNNLIKNVTEHLALDQRYYKLKAKMLGIEDFSTYDTRVDVLKSEHKEMSLGDALASARKILAPLGQEYLELFDTAIKDRWADFYPNKNKSTGAYSTSAYGANPVMLLNFNNDKEYISTIVHEFGHSAHSYYSNNYQPQRKANYEIFVAEVPSTVNECLYYLDAINSAKTKEDKVRAYSKFFEIVHAVIFTQSKFSEFEKNVYDAEAKGESLTSEKISDIYFSLNEKYWGDAVICPQISRYEWSYVTHFYYDFYVYKYVTGFISAFLIASKIYGGDNDVRQKYLHFLTRGCEAEPLELLKDVGIDLTKKSTYDEVFNKIKEMLNDYEKIVNKKN